MVGRLCVLLSRGAVAEVKKWSSSCEAVVQEIASWLLVKGTRSRCAERPRRVSRDELVGKLVEWALEPWWLSAAVLGPGVTG